MRINLRRVQVLVAQQLLERPDVDAVSEQQRGGPYAGAYWEEYLSASSPADARWILTRWWTVDFEMRIPARRQEERLRIDGFYRPSGGQVVVDSFRTGVVEVNNCAPCRPCRKRAGSRCGRRRDRARPAPKSAARS